MAGWTVVNAADESMYVTEDDAGALDFVQVDENGALWFLSDEGHVSSLFAPGAWVYAFNGDEDAA